MITLRKNQVEPIDKAIRFFSEKKPKPSLIVLPTAFGKYKGDRITDLPLNYRQWMIRTFDWNSRNEKLRTSIMASMR